MIRGKRKQEQQIIIYYTTYDKSVVEYTFVFHKNALNNEDRVVRG